jgi:hypothetical protein
LRSYGKTTMTQKLDNLLPGQKSTGVGVNVCRKNDFLSRHQSAMEMRRT